MSEAYRAALSRQYQDGALRLRSMTADTITQMFLGQGSWRTGDIDQFLGQALPVIHGGQQAMARFTDAYLSARIADRFGGQAAPLGVEAAAAIRGVDPEVVYRRPFAQLWTELGDGVPFPVALDHSVQRLVSLAHTDLQLTKTHTAQAVFGAHDRVSLYRRVPKGRDTCALCLIASTQPYAKRDLLPIHPGCDCGVEEIADPSQAHDPDLLDQVHDAVARDLGPDYQDYGGRASDYRKIVVTREHGELGPTLAVSGHRFTGPNDLG